MIRMPPVYNRRYRSIYIIVATLLILLIPCWFGIIAPYFKKMPDNFTYQANILSIDNFYDESTKKYLGEHISKTSFSYRVIEINSSYDIIENKFSVRTLNDKPIISITRLYFINPYTWKHVKVAGKPLREGYLFGPHWAYQQDFSYWHINYNSSASMKLIGQEKIDGLTVNHYESNYEADQTANLGNLPGVPESRGIRAKIKLQLWIEPVSGWLVKYQDNTLAVYYDKKNGNEISPWNMFSNRYTETSVRKQVHIAILQKWKLISIYVAVPWFLLAMASFLFWRGLIQRRVIVITTTYFKFAGNVMVLLGFVFLFTGSIYYFFGKRHDISVYTVGISEWDNTASHKKSVQGFKDGLALHGYIEGKNIKFITSNPDSNIEKQVDIIQYFQKRRINLIYTISTTGSLIAKGMTNRTPVIFSGVSYPEEANVISSLRSSKNNVVGVRNYISPAIQFNFFERIYPNVKTIGFVHQKGGPDSEMQYQEFKELLDRRNVQVKDIAATDLPDLSRQLEQGELVDAIFLACDNLIQAGSGELIAKYGIEHKIPTFSCDKDTIQKGALMGIRVDPYLSGVFAGKQAALILRGAEPSWLHTEQFQRGYFMINPVTAKILGITIPEEILNNADYIVKEKM